MNRRWRRAALAALGGVALVLLGWRLASGEGDWSTVERDDLVVSVEVTGVLQAVETSLISPPAVAGMWDFKIAFLVPEGSQVTQGQPVLGFDTSQLVKELQTKQAERDGAREEIGKRRGELEVSLEDLRLQRAEAEAGERLGRLKVGHPEELLSAVEVRSAELDLELAQRSVAHFRRRIELAMQAADAELAALQEKERRAAGRVVELNEAIAALTVKAPRQGTVIYVTSWRDEKKKVGDSCWRNERVLEIPDLRAMRASVEVAEVDSGKIAAGQPVTFRLDAHPDVEITGRVERPTRSVEQRSWRDLRKVAEVPVTLDYTDSERMRPGMRFRGRVEVDRRSAVLVIPVTAVLTGSNGPLVWRDTAVGPRPVAVELGQRNPELVEVIAGLAEGDRVLRRGPEQP